MSILSWLGRGKQVMDLAEAKIAAASEAVERGIEAVIKDAQTLARETIDTFDGQMMNTFASLSEYERQLVAEIESKSGILGEVRDMLVKLRSIGADVAGDLAPAAPAVQKADAAAPAVNAPVDAVHETAAAT